MAARWGRTVGILKRDKFLAAVQPVDSLKMKLSTPPSSSLTLEDVQQIVLQSTQTIQKTFQKEIQRMEQKIMDVKEEIMEEMVIQNDKMRGDILVALEGLAQHIERVDSRVDCVMEFIQSLETKIAVMESEMEQQLIKTEKLEKEILRSQCNKMEFAIRIRGVKENLKENLELEMAQVLACFLQCDPGEMIDQIDKIYRVNSWIAKQRNLPRDVVIYFFKRSTRNAIIQAAYKKRLQIAGQKVIIFKEIPPIILRERKDFLFLSRELKRRKIMFRWEIPVGIAVIYAGIKYRLNTVLKARDFYINVLKAGAPPSLQKKRLEERQKEDQEMEKTMISEEGGKQIEELEKVLQMEYRRMEKDQRRKNESYVLVQEKKVSEVGRGKCPKI